MRAVALGLILGACAPEASIEVIEPPFLVDSYPGNGTLVPADQATPLLFRFSKPIADAAAANQHITLELMNESGGADTTLSLSTCSASAEDYLLECPVNVAPQAGNRFRITVGTGLVFLSGESLLSPHQRWFQTLPD